ncbi:MAG: serine/threonine-protein kinase [Acidobacteriia bacterium]|nr:serine/threonine-protein kinase [Terriglobia bacterium]
MTDGFDPASWAAVSALFDELTQLSEVDRGSWLEALRGRDPTGHAKLLRLLDADAAAAAAEFLGSPAVARAVEHAGSPTHEGSAADPTGDAEGSVGSRTIGPYRLLRLIGEGGMGEVWLAEQVAPVRRRVALKLVKAGMDTREVIARFEAERQALAVMEHPAVAKVFDAGETPSGRPYFVMEYVPGEPINAYCDRQQLTPAERIALFVEVCDGVQHAHQKGIIHRDLKPSNILVETREDKPLPRIIDFGIAKAAALRLTDRSLLTELGAMIGTPEYMSPEQAGVSSLDVDTRTDVYSLGVILYELLVGALPLDSATLRGAAFDEIRRLIREVDPPRPSERATGPGPATLESAKNRRTEPGRLAGLLRGDLDWITMKALDKDRARRYASPSELAEDLERHLRNLPVSAGPPSLAYRARKFVRRHRLGTAAAALIALSVVAGTIGTSLALVRARRAEAVARQEAEAARQVSDFMRGLFRVSDPGVSRGARPTAREILDRGAARIDRDLASQPAVRARLLGVLAGVYQNLGEFEPAERLFEEALTVRRSALPDDKAGLAALLDQLAWLYYLRNEFGKARPPAREALAIQEAMPARDDHVYANTLHTLASILDKSGDHAQAVVYFERALEVRQKAFGPESVEVARSLNSLAIVRQSLGDLASARAYYERALAIAPKTIGEDHPHAITWLNNLGTLLYDMGAFEESRKVHARCLALRERVFGPDHPDVAQSLENLGASDLELKEPRKAIPLCRRAAEIFRKAYGDDNLDMMDALQCVGDSLAASGAGREAEPIFDRIIRTSQAQPGNGDSRLGYALLSLGQLETQQRRLGEARRTLDRAVALREKTDGKASVSYAECMAAEAQLLAAEGRPEAAAALYEEAVKAQSAVQGESHPHVLAVLAAWAEVLERAGKRDEALRLEARIRAAQPARH